MKKLSLLIFLLGTMPLTVHLTAMEIVPRQSFSQPPRHLRPPAEKFAYYPCIPALTTLAIMAIPDEQPEGKAPMKLMPDVCTACEKLYIYATRFKNDPEITNPLEHLKLNDLRNTRYTEITQPEYERNLSLCITKEQALHLLAHADLTQEILNDFLSKLDTHQDIVKYLALRGARGPFFDQWQQHPLHNAVTRHALLKERLTFDHHTDGSLSYSFLDSDQVLKTEPLTASSIDEKVNDMSPLALAAAYDDVTTVEELVPFASQENKNNALLAATTYEASAPCAQLIAHNADVNTRDKYDWTPLHLATLRGCYNTVSLLLKHKANVAAQTNVSFFTPLHLAALKGYTDIANLLVEYGANVNESGKSYSPLYSAVMNKHIKMVHFFIEHGANVKSTKIDEIPLQRATSDNSTEITALLIAGGATVNIKDKDGLTPLHNAVKNNSINIAKILIGHGADLNALDDKGKTPLNIAQQLKNTVMIELLEQASLKKPA